MRVEIDVKLGVAKVSEFCIGLTLALGQGECRFTLARASPASRDGWGSAHLKSLSL